tara:strand:+ start:215 stop:1252 length:1038 start_codon:yes stop_codon:yes gene_type:complete
MPKEKVGLLRELCNEKIDVIFDHLGIDTYDHGRYLNCPCPVHLGDNPRGFSWQKEIGIWKCFTHNCQANTGSDIFGLVMAIEELSFVDTLHLLESIIGTDCSDEVIERIRNKKAISRESQPKKEIIPEKQLEKLVWDPAIESYMISKRGFSSKALNEFEVGYCNTTQALFHNRIVLPIRDRDGDVVGATARWADEEVEGRPKWLHEGNINDYLYGFYKTKDFIESSRVIVLVEGPLGVIRLWQAGVRNAVAVFGTSISRRQHRIILSSSALKCYVAFDNDVAGNRAADSIVYGKGTVNNYECLGKFMNVEKIDLGEHSDLDEMSIPQIRKLFLELKQRDNNEDSV